jgi:hypothetical protein
MARTTAEKLGIRSGHAVLALNAPASYESLAGPLPPGVTLRTEAGGGPADCVHLFAPDRAALAAFAEAAARSVKPFGLFWISYPKQSARVATDLNRDRGWEAITSRGFEAVAQVAVDDVWSALRFRRVEEVGRTAPSAAKRSSGR